MAQRQLFIRPELESFKPDPARPYYGRFLTYSHYNYLRPGLVSRYKRSRLEAALKLAQPHFGPATNAIDMGCADGILLPSLSNYFGHVVGADFDERSVRSACNLVASMGLRNVEVINNRNMSAGEVRARLNGRRYRVMFLLETLEHIGESPATMYEDKLAFLDRQFELLEPDGTIIVSVPKMVGPAFGLKYLVQSALQMHRERVTIGEIWRAVVHRDASALEPRWKGGHIGFNQHKLEGLIPRRYDVVERRNLVASLMWKIRRPERLEARAAVV